jgi:type I restriction enzyme S subunit
MAMKSFQLNDILEFQSKSRRKAGEGLLSGDYPFFTSSQLQKKWLNKADYSKESILLGTGGLPSVHHCIEFSASTDVFILAPKWKNISAKYVYYYLAGNKLILERGFKGVGLKHLSRSYTEKIQIPIPVDEKGIPNLSEQLRIVDFLSEAEKIKKNRIEADIKTKEIIPALFIKMFGDPVGNPMNWKKVPLGKLGTLDRGKSQHRPRNAPELYGGVYPFIQTGDVTNAGWRLFSHTQTYSDKGFAQSKLWPKNTLCITIAANIAKTTILNFEACFPDSVVGFTSNAESNADYVQGLFVFLQKGLEDMAPQAAQQNINLAILRDLMVPLPPIGLQNQFSVIVNEVLEYMEKQAKSAQQISDVFSTLIFRAFNEKT